MIKLYSGPGGSETTEEALDELYGPPPGKNFDE
jgi:hypothetical protein